MTETPPPDASEWVVGPPPPGAISIRIETGEGAEPSPEVKQAIENLVATLMADEVQGFGAPTCGDLDSCTAYYCDLRKCLPIVSQPCFANITCTVKS